MSLPAKNRFPVPCFGTSGRPVGFPARRRELLLEVLGLLRHAENVPLQCSVDASGLATFALARIMRTHGDDRSDGGGSMTSTDREFARYLGEILEATAYDGPLPGLVRISADPGDSGPGNGAAPTVSHLAACVARLHGALTLTHPRAGSILALRLEGLDSREISARLDRPAWLIRRILRDLRDAWRRADEP